MKFTKTLDEQREEVAADMEREARMRDAALNLFVCCKHMLTLIERLKREATEDVQLRELTDAQTDLRTVIKMAEDAQ